MVDRSCVFETSSLRVLRTSDPAVVRLSPGDALCTLTTEKQVFPVPQIEEELVFGLCCWLVARGARRLNLNGEVSTIEPHDLSMLPRERPRRLVSICPSNTEMLAALGFGPQLVALDSSSDWPPAIRDRPRLGMDLVRGRRG